MKSGGYASADEAWKNPGSNIEYTVTVSGDGWKSSTGNGQYLVRTDRDTLLVLQNVAVAEDLVKFACQMPDAGQKPGSELPESVDTRVVSLVGPDKETPVNVARLQLCTSDGTPIENNTFDFSGETIPADGYRLQIHRGRQQTRRGGLSEGPLRQYRPLRAARIPHVLRVRSYGFGNLSGEGEQHPAGPELFPVFGRDRLCACSWTAEFSVDRG